MVSTTGLVLLAVLVGGLAFMAVAYAQDNLSTNSTNLTNLTGSAGGSSAAAGGHKCPHDASGADAASG